MKIYVVVTTVKDFGFLWDVIRYFSEDKEKCEDYVKEEKWNNVKIKEFNSETPLDVSSQIIW